MKEEEQDNQEISLKIVLIGDSSVGKTSIIRRYIENSFNSCELSNITAHPSPKSLIIDDKKIKLDIWDTVGQEKYRSIGKQFYKDSYIVIFVYDITEKQTFEDLKTFWVNDLKNYGEKYTIKAIVGNKLDLYEIEEVNEEKAREYTNEINSEFFLVSAKNGDNIEKLFTTLVKKYFEHDFTKKIGEIFDEKKIGQTTKISKDKLKKKSKKKCC